MSLTPTEPEGDGTVVPSAQDPYIAPDPGDPTVLGGTDHAGNPLSVKVSGSEAVPISTVAKSGVLVAQVTQVRRPWRTTARTVFQAAVGLATLLPFVATGVYGTDGDYPAAVVQVLAVDAAITRVMALPQVEDFLQKFLPFLSAAPQKG